MKLDSLGILGEAIRYSAIIVLASVGTFGSESANPLLPLPQPGVFMKLNPLLFPSQPQRSPKVCTLLIISFVVQIFGAAGLAGYLSLKNGAKVVQTWIRQNLKLGVKSTFLNLFAIALSLTFFLNACSIGQNQALKPLQVGITSWAGFDIALYAQASEIFKQRGLKVELVRFDNQQDSSRAVMNNRLDAAFVSFWDVMQVDASNGSPVVLMTTNISAGADGIVAKSSIKSVEDLRGKRVGAKLGTVNHLILLEALKAHHIKPAEVEIMDYSNEVSAQEIASGAIDAAILWQPMLGKTAKAIQGNVIYTTKEVDSLVIDGLMSSDKTIAAKEAELTQFILAWFDVMHAVETKPTEVFDVVGKKLGQIGAAFASDYAGLRKGDMALNQRMFQADGRLSQAKNKIIQLLKEDPRHGRTIRQDVKIDGTLVKKAMEAWKA